VLTLVACDARPPAGSGPYGAATMDLKAPPARVTTTRRAGAFAAGNALSMTAVLKPLDPTPVKGVRLDATHKIIEISPGVKFAGWTGSR
jgi:nitrite reductase (NO-forming)